MRLPISRAMIYHARTTPHQPFNARFEGQKLAAFHELMCACDPPSRHGLGSAQAAKQGAITYGSEGASVGGAWGAAIGAVVGAVIGAMKGRPSHATSKEKAQAQKTIDMYRLNAMNKALGRDLPGDVWPDLLVAFQATGDICCAMPADYETKAGLLTKSIEDMSRQAISQPVGSKITVTQWRTPSKVNAKVQVTNPGPDAAALYALWFPIIAQSKDKTKHAMASYQRPVTAAMLRDYFDYMLSRVGSPPIPKWAPTVYLVPPPAAVTPPTPAIAPAPLPSLVSRVSRAAVPAPAPVSLPPAPAPAPLPPVPNLTPAVADNTAALIQQLLAQGASQQQATVQAINSLAQQGVTPTPQVQDAVKSEVATTAAAADSGTSSALPWLLGAGALWFVLRRRH